jgi:DNA polymerase-1
MVHCPVASAPAVSAAIERAGDQARRLLFGDTPVRFPLNVSIVDCYADAK